MNQKHGIAFWEVYLLGMLFTAGYSHVTIEKSLTVIEWFFAYLFWPITLGVSLSS